jgi:SAM-dependent methyltransferase
VNDVPGDPRMYGDLAEWWPLISPPEEYAVEAALFGEILAAGAPPVRTVLELGSGGGHNASHLEGRFDLTLVELSPSMVAVSRSLNPGCEHHVGDMRTVRLGRTFDAVFVHDAVMYMTTEEDLLAAVETAWVHTRPGGRALFVPDCTTETFVPFTDHGGSDGPDGRGARYLEWVWDPDPSDTVCRSEFSFVLREADGSTWSVHDPHEWGLFPRTTWLAVLEAVGFSVEAIPEVTVEDHEPRELFLGTRPS